VEGDYERAGVPMLNVTSGEAATRRQILIYSLILVPFALAPAFTGLGGPIYLAVAAAGGAVFLLLAARLSLPFMGRAGDAAHRRAGASDVAADAEAGADSPTRAASQPSLPMKGRARRLFAFSILYLFLLFAALSGEHLFGVKPLSL
jgi:protoheme IX farnesyltransferase